MNKQSEMFDGAQLGEAPALIERRNATFQQEAPRHPAAAFALAPEQAAAQEAALAFIAGAAPGAYFVMHGLAGTGKTVVLASLAAQLEERGKRYLLAAPTGKAATVLTRKAGKSVKTLHRLLYAPPEERDGRLTWSKAWPPGSLAGSVVLLDEASMVDKQLAADLLETGAVVVAFGDPGQLSPVNGHAFFTQADFVLHEIRRQASDSPIIRQAYRVRQGLSYEDDGEQFQVVDRADFHVHAAWADIVLCWKNETRLWANRIIRRQRGVPVDAPPQPGEPIMILRNAPWLGFMNGEIVTVAAYQPADGLCGELTVGGGKKLQVWLGDEKDAPWRCIPCAMAYAITVHKSQGSEWLRVLILDDHTSNDRKEWLYTAITRAASEVRIVPPASHGP